MQFKELYSDGSCMCQSAHLGPQTSWVITMGQNQVFQGVLPSPTKMHLQGPLQWRLLSPSELQPSVLFNKLDYPCKSYQDPNKQLTFFCMFSVLSVYAISDMKSKSNGIAFFVTSGSFSNEEQYWWSSVYQTLPYINFGNTFKQMQLQKQSAITIYFQRTSDWLLAITKQKS